MWYGYIYKTTCLVNSKIYVGKRKFENDLKQPYKIYLGSGKLLKKAIQKYGSSNFNKEILICCIDSNSLNEQERFWIKELKASTKGVGYNLTEGGDWGEVFFRNFDNWEEILKNRNLKIKTALTGNNHSDERNAAKSNNWNNQPEICCIFCHRLGKISIIKKHIKDCLKNPNRQALVHSQETKDKIRNKMSQYKHSDEALQKLRKNKYKLF